MENSAEAKASRFLIGLMCGTSGDGVSAALVKTSGYGVDREIELIAYSVLPYPGLLHDQLFRLFPPNRFSVDELAIVHTEFGKLLGSAALEIARQAGIPIEQVTAVVVQAPTIIHLRPEDGKIGTHIEVGEAAIISEMTGVLVVSDLRPSDVAAGGHGAPLSVFADYVLFAHESLGRAVQNIGGIANVTFIPAGGKMSDLLSFDTGPGNMVIDGVVRILSGGAEEYDRDGVRAGRGKISEAFLSELLDMPYLKLVPPKTTGREEFGDQFVQMFMRRGRELGLSGDDLVATATALTARCIGFHYTNYLIPKSHLDEVILYGGGAHNKTLVKMLESAIAPIRVRMHDEFSIKGDAREAVTWAILGDEAIAGRAANVPATSGARHPVVLGKFVCTRPGRGRWTEY